MLKEDLTGYVKIYQMLRMIFQMQLGRLNLLMISLKMKKTSIMHTMHIFMETTGLIKSSRIIKKHGLHTFIETHITGSIGYLFMTIWKMEN